MLCSLWPELFIFTTTYVPPARHILHQCPQVQGVGIISHNRSTRLYIAYLIDVFVVIPMENDRWSANNIVFDEVMQILVGLVEYGKESVWEGRLTDRDRAKSDPEH